MKPCIARVRQQRRNRDPLHLIRRPVLRHHFTTGVCHGLLFLPIWPFRPLLIITSLENRMSTRRALPQRRAAETFEVKHGKHTVAVSVGYYSDGTLGELFVSGAKCGSELDATMRDAAVLLSIAIQMHLPLEMMRHAITREANGAASSIIGAVIDMIAAQMAAPAQSAPASARAE